MTENSVTPHAAAGVNAATSVGSSSSTTGNTVSTRPTRLNPIACDCCDSPVGYMGSSRSAVSTPFGMLPYVICGGCARSFGNDGPNRKEVTTFVIRRAGRFGLQWEEAVKAQLGWPA